jgi:hypothetical protein
MLPRGSLKNDNNDLKNLVDSRYLIRIMYLFRLTRIMIRTLQTRVTTSAEAGGGDMHLFDTD